MKNYHKFWIFYLQTHDTMGTLKSIKHYESSMCVCMNTVATTIIGTININMTIRLQLDNVSGSEKIVHMTEEWNDVPLIGRDNTVFPIGWTAEMMRIIIARIVVLLSCMVP